MVQALCKLDRVSRPRFLVLRRTFSANTLMSALVLSGHTGDQYGPSGRGRLGTAFDVLKAQKRRPEASASLRSTRIKVVRQDVLDLTGSLRC